MYWDVAPVSTWVQLPVSHNYWHTHTDGNLTDVSESLCIRLILLTTTCIVLYITVWHHITWRWFPTPMSLMKISQLCCSQLDIYTDTRTTPCIISDCLSCLQTSRLPENVEPNFLFLFLSLCPQRSFNGIKATVCSCACVSESVWERKTELTRVSVLNVLPSGQRASLCSR